MNQKGIARIIEISPDVFQGEILFDGSMIPVMFMCRDFHSTVSIKMTEQFPMVEQVRRKVYECELDHINLFGCRSDAQDWTAPMTQEQSDELAAILDRQEEWLNNQTGRAE